MDERVIADKVRSTMSKVFGLDEASISDSSSQDSIEKWDSLGHMNLVVALEEEFGVQLTDDQVIELLNFKLIVQTIKEIT